LDEYNDDHHTEAAQDEAEVQTDEMSTDQAIELAEKRQTAIES